MPAEAGGVALEERYSHIAWRCAQRIQLRGVALRFKLRLGFLFPQLLTLLITESQERQGLVEYQGKRAWRWWASSMVQGTKLEGVLSS